MKFQQAIFFVNITQFSNRTQFQVLNLLSLEVNAILLVISFLCAVVSQWEPCMAENWFLNQIGPTGCVMTSHYAREFHFVSFRFWRKIGGKKKTFLDNYNPEQFQGQINFFHIPKMLVYANQRENDSAIFFFFFFFLQKQCNYYLGSYKNYLPEILRRLNARAEKKILEYHGTRLPH